MDGNKKKIPENQLAWVIAISIAIFILIIALFCGPIVTAWLNHIK